MTGSTKERKRVPAGCSDGISKGLALTRNAVKETKASSNLQLRHSQHAVICVAVAAGIQVHANQEEQEEIRNAKRVAAWIAIVFSVVTCIAWPLLALPAGACHFECRCLFR